jgi:hypothetical protein
MRRSRRVMVMVMVMVTVMVTAMVTAMVTVTDPSRLGMDPCRRRTDA